MRLAARLAVLALAAAACQAAPPSDRPAVTDPAGLVARAAAPSDLTLDFRQQASGLTSPVAMAAPDDGTGRLFIAEQRGTIKVRTAGGTVRSSPFLDIRGRVNDAGNEQGLLGLAFHPNYKQNRRFYVAYTDSGGDLRVEQYRTTSSYDRNTSSTGSRRGIIVVGHPPPTNHNAGQLAFYEGKLFISTGDGGDGGDPWGNAQDTTVLLGKILRLNVDRSCGANNYCVPSGNPFVDGPGKGQIWHYGLRNPWRFSFDEPTDSMWIADVGQNELEEVNRTGAGSGGKNFGWDCREGKEPFEPGNAYCDGETFKDPLRQYAHLGSRCAVIGGHVYRGSADPEMRGTYFYADHCSNEVWGVANVSGTWQGAKVATGPDNITSFGVTEDGRLWAVSRAGRLYRVRSSVS